MKESEIINRLLGLTLEFEDYVRALRYPHENPPVEESFITTKDRMWAYTLRKQAYASHRECNPHPEAPHGFDSSIPINEETYDCICEWWRPKKEEYEYSSN